jgi:hypothetical protein
MSIGLQSGGHLTECTTTAVLSGNEEALLFFFEKTHPFLWGFGTGRSANRLSWVPRLRAWIKAHNPKGKRKNEEAAEGCGKTDHLPVERET